MILRAYRNGCAVLRLLDHVDGGPNEERCSENP
jgi:hypothetical protein